MSLRISSYLAYICHGFGAKYGKNDLKLNLLSTLFLKNDFQMSDIFFQVAVNPNSPTLNYGESTPKHSSFSLLMSTILVCVNNIW